VSTWGRPRDRIAPNGRYGGRELWFGQRRVYRSISSPEKALLLSNAFVPLPRPQRRLSVYEWATVVRSWPSFCEWQRRHFLRFEVVWGYFSCLKNVAVILDFRAAFIVVYRCLSDLESSSIRFEAVAANTLGIPSFWGCLRRTQSLAGGWKFQWTAAKSSDMSIQLRWWKWSGTDYYSIRRRGDLTLTLMTEMIIDQRWNIRHDGLLISINHRSDAKFDREPRTLTWGQREAITYLFSVIFKWKLSISSTVTLLLCSTWRYFLVSTNSWLSFLLMSVFLA